MNEALRSIQWDRIFENQSVNEMVNTWSNLFLETARKYIPTKLIRVTPGEPPWLTNDIKKYMRIRNRLHRKAKHSGNQVHWAQYRKSRNFVVSKLREAKNKHRSDLTEQISSSDSGNSKLWWKLVKHVLRNQNAISSEFPPMKDGDVIISDDLEKAELFNRYFADQCTLDNEDTEPPVVTYELQSLLENVTLEQTFVEECICLLKISKAGGPDNINPRLLRGCSKSISKPLCLIFNKSLRTSFFPCLWKDANMSPLHKKLSKQFTKHFRPISLLSCTGKIFERCVFKFLFNHCIDNKIITKFQSGYQPGDSPVQQLLELYDIILEAMDDGKFVKFVFLDVSRAFDRVWHKGLLSKLYAIGIRGHLLNWFSSYLSMRRQRVVISGQTSSWKYVNAGVPQGSILGPLLFLIYINDIASIVESNIRLFADDTSLFFIADRENEDIANMTLNGDLSVISLWADQWFITLNDSKTVSMTCTRLHNINPTPLFLKRAPISGADHHRHLGISLSSNGSWEHHIENICVRAMKRVDCLRGMKFLLDRRSLEKLYFIFIRPILEYGDIIWDNCSHRCSEMLERVQLAAARIVTGATQKVEIRLLYEEIKWERLCHRREKHKLVEMYKIVHGLSPDYLRQKVPDLFDTGHNTRNSENIPLIFCRSEQRRNSFFPSTIRSWRSLESNIRQSSSLNNFKKQLKRHVDKAPAYYHGGDRVAQIHHARMRMHCCTVNDFMYRCDLTASPQCACGAVKETVEHFLTDCPRFNSARHELLGPFSTDSHLDLKCLLFSDHSKNEEYNRKLFSNVEKYILKTKRFTSTQ